MAGRTLCLLLCTVVQLVFSQLSTDELGDKLFETVSTNDASLTTPFYDDQEGAKAAGADPTMQSPPLRISPVFSIPEAPEAAVYVSFDTDVKKALISEFHGELNEEDLLADGETGEDEEDDDFDLAGISCALISGECAACAKTTGCGYCASAGVCMDSRGPCASARPITWHWQCSDHNKWWLIVVIATCMLISCAVVTGCCLKLLCCCCKI